MTLSLELPLYILGVFVLLVLLFLYLGRPPKTDDPGET